MCALGPDPLRPAFRKVEWLARIELVARSFDIGWTSNRKKFAGAGIDMPQLILAIIVNRIELEFAQRAFKLRYNI
jgi:hypothetical protein